MTAGKNSRIRNWRSEALFASLVLLVVSVFVSRAALSISTMLFVLLAVAHRGVLAQLRSFLQTPYLLLFSLLFFIPALSGLWSRDADKWLDVVRIKLPLLFFPLAFAGNWQLSAKQWRWLRNVFLFAVAAGCVWSLAHYAQNVAATNESYLRAKTLRTPLEDDHVRFSWLVAAAFVVSAFALQVARAKARILPALLCGFFAVYLHVLAARTGLLSLYLFLLLYSTWWLLRRKNKTTSFAALLAVAALPVVAYAFLPTFRARVDYIRYDLSFVRKSAYLPGSSDGARTLSLKAGWYVLKRNPFGVGAGDVMQEADKWYAANVPNVLPTDKFYPSSEWLMYGAFAGWAGVIVFTVVMLAPFFLRLPHKIFWTGLNATAAFSFAFDMGLEVQYGVLLYALVVLCWWKACFVKRQT